jgi:hypothetical protein
MTIADLKIQKIYATPDNQASRDDSQKIFSGNPGVFGHKRPKTRVSANDLHPKEKPPKLLM